MSETSLTAAVKRIAGEEGFARVGIVAAGVSFDDSAYRSWLAAGRHASMAYMSRDVDKRYNPGQLVEGASSIICLAISYAPASSWHGHPGHASQGHPAPAPQLLQDGTELTSAGEDTHAPREIIARYARGRDYHKVLKQRCHRLMDRLRDIEPGFTGRAFVDTAPIAERSLAVAGGLGWIGRNGCLIAPRLGSYVVLGEIICNLPLVADRPCPEVPDGCGDCRACIDACPTGAIVADGVIDARLCRSYLTIEHRQAIDQAMWPKMAPCVFGCDACQAACPHNQGLPPGNEEVIGPRAEVAELTIADVLGWSVDDWDAATRGSAMRRETYEMFLRNAVLTAGSSGDADLAGPLTLLSGSRPELADEIAWAIGRIDGQ